MPGEYRFLREAHPDLIYWQVTSLQNGIHTSYPGHGGYPPDFDPRTRAWYQVPRERGRLVWIGPYLDASSEERILTVAMPVRRPNGSFAGVTAIDVTVADVVAGMRLPDSLAFSARSMLVLFKSDPQTPSRRRAAVIARPGLDPESKRWSTQLEMEWLESDDPETTREMISVLSEGAFGDLRAPYHGEDSLWAFGPVDEDGAFLVAIVPFDEAVAQAVAAEKDALERTWAQLGTTGAVALLVVLIVLLCALVGSRQVTEPIRRLVATADRIARGELDARAQVLGNDEFGRLAHDFNAMVPKLRERLELKQSLSLAMEVQQNLLPHAPPNVDGFDVAGKSIYCDETGGDYYDYLDLSTIGPKRLGIVVGDVTGHGVAAAMLMTTGRALLRSRAAASNGNLMEMLSSLNRILDADMGDDRFMTLFYMVLDSNALEARWATAGHDAALTYDPATGEFGELAGCDLPLGIDPDWIFTEHPPLHLKDGQIVVIGTDGIWEARNPERKFFGKDALREVIRENAARSACEICDAVTDAVARFRRGRPQEDDVTLVVIKVAAARRGGQSDAIALTTGDSVSIRTASGNAP
jgi:sigma-B regulation protein RsbU (phosphoserine phosphatase)